MIERQQARCVQVEVAEDEVELVSDLLWTGGATAIHELDRVGSRVTLVAGIPRPAEAALLASLADRWTADVFDADYDGWLDAWRPFARPARAGRVVTYPPWRPPPWPDLPTTDGDRLVAIDPEGAFGSGTHDTTVLMLAELQEILPVAGGDLDPPEVLDVGCGSGVLSVTAAVLGAPRVVAVDIESRAVVATRRNAAHNGVGDRVEASTTPVARLTGTFGVVLANILAPVLVELAPDLAARVGQGGRLVLSGLQADQLDPVVAAYPGFAVLAERGAGDWRQLTLTRA